MGGLKEGAVGDLKARAVPEVLQQKEAALQMGQQNHPPHTPLGLVVGW